MTIHGYEIIGAWENSTFGKIAFAIKGGRRYVLKKYLSPVAPIDNGILDSKTVEHNQKLFDEFVAMRQNINNVLSSCTSILVPCDQFVEKNCYVEVSELVENAISVHDIYNNLSEQEKMLLMTMLAGALITLHNKKIVHADISLQNVIVYRDHTGMYKCKLIGYDSCFFVNNVPNEIAGTVDFYSPEIGKYINAEDNYDELKKDISEKTDIFSLGLVYHVYLAGTFPKAVSLTDELQRRQDSGTIIYPWVVLNSGCDLEISDQITNEQYRSLISDMLSVDANVRPSATDVLERLRKLDTLVGKSILRESVSKRSTFLDESVTATVPTVFAEPWPEHNIKFDIDVIKSKGFVRSEQTEMNGIKGYKFYKAAGTGQFIKVDMLIVLRMAVKK